MSSVTTLQGETWDMLAFRLWGKGGELHMHRLIEANSSHRDTVFFSAGILLTVPDVLLVAMASAPPWRRKR